MNTHMLCHVRQLWNNPMVSRELNRANQLKWVRSVRYLGDKWLLAVYVEKLSEKRPV